MLRVAEQVQARPGGEPGEEYRSLFERREQIGAWLSASRPLRLTRIRELLARDGTDIAYWTLHRFARTELGFGKPTSTFASHLVMRGAPLKGGPGAARRRQPSR